MSPKTKKAPLRERDPLRYRKNVMAACKAGQWASLLGPLGVLFGVKWNEYIAIAEGEGGTVKLTVGAVLAIIVAVVVVYRNCKHQEKIEGKVTMLSWVIGLGVAFALSYLLSVVMKDLALILGVEFAGACASYGFDMGAQSQSAYIRSFSDETAKYEARKPFPEGTEPAYEEGEPPAHNRHSVHRSHSRRDSRVHRR